MQRFWGCHLWYSGEFDSLSLKLKARTLSRKSEESPVWVCNVEPRAGSLQASGPSPSYVPRRLYWLKTKRDRTEHVLSYREALARTKRKDVEPTLRKRGILFMGFVARTKRGRLQKQTMFTELAEEGGRQRAEKRRIGRDAFWNDLAAFGTRQKGCNCRNLGRG